MINERKIGILLGYLNIVLQIIIGIIYVPILLKYIGKSEYGIYQLIGSLIAYLSIMDFGITSAITRYYTIYKAKNDKKGMENILFISFVSFFLITILLFILGCLIYINFEKVFSNNMTFEEIISAKNLFALLLINILFTISTMSFKAIMNAHERFFAMKGLESIQLILQPVLVVIILQEYPYAFSVALVQTILNGILTIIRIFYCIFFIGIKVKYHYINSELIYGLGKLSISTFIVAIVDQIFFRTNQIILGIQSGIGAVAIYSIASVIYINYMALSWSVSGVFLPKVTEMVAKNISIKEISNLFIKVGKFQYYILMFFLLGFLVLGKDFIYLWAGKDYLGAYLITLVIIIPFTIDLIQNLGICILQAYNCYGIRAKVCLIMGLLNIVFGIPMAKYFNGLGCAIVTGIMLFIGNGIIMNYYYIKKIKLDIMKFWYVIGKISYKLWGYGLIAFFINLYLGNIDLYWDIFFIKVLIFFVGYLFVLIRFCMNKNEKIYIKNKLKYKRL